MWRWLPILAPTVVGAILSVLIARSDLSNPLFVVRANLSVVAFLMGLVLTFAAGIALWVWDWREAARNQVSDQAAQDRRQFLQRLDHELKNPLTAVLAGLANLEVSDGSATQSDTLDSVRAQVRRLSRLVSDLRKLSDLETRPLERAPVDVGNLLEQAYEVSQSHPEAVKRQITLTIPQAPWPLPMVKGDHDLLFLAVHNLLDNALKFSQPGDTIELRAFEDGSTVVIEVADTGLGIPPGEVPHVWEELYRGQMARGISGSGLGLALTRSIVTRHGGKVNLRSRAHQGTVFTIRLPAAEVTNR